MKYFILWLCYLAIGYVSAPKLTLLSLLFVSIALTAPGWVMLYVYRDKSK